jgi:predicted MFS family arabinose efflux permease
MNRNATRRKAFIYSYIEGGFYALMVGSAETYALIFAAKNGVAGTDFGILSTLPIVMGAFAAWLIPSLTPQDQLKSRILWAVGVQILGLLLVTFSVFLQNFYSLLLLGLCFYWIGGMISGPLWLDWIAGWLPHYKFSSFNARRNSFVTIMTLISYVSSSFIVMSDLGRNSFFIIFSLATIFRILSLLMMSRQSSPIRYQLKKENPVVLSGIFQAHRWIIAFIAMMIGFKFAATYASPYFTPYMLNELKLSLEDYVWITAIPFLSRAILLNQWSRTGFSFQPIAGLKICLFVIATVAFLWSSFSSTRALILIEILSGAAWGGFDLFTIIILQRCFKDNSRPVIGLYIALMNLIALLAAAIGGQVLQSGFSYQQLFHESGSLRLSIAVIFLIAANFFPQFSSSRENYQNFLSSTLSLRPSMALIGRLIPPRARETKETKKD